MSINSIAGCELIVTLCKIDEESLEHTFVCTDGLICKFSDNISGHMDNLMSLKDIGSLQRVSRYLLKYDKYRELVIQVWNILTFIKYNYFDFYKLASFTDFSTDKCWFLFIVII